MTKVYLAASYGRKEEIRNVAIYLKAFFPHVEIVSTWLEECYSPSVDIRTLPGGINQAFAEKDIAEIGIADVLIFFAEDQDHQPPRGGRHVEFGIALALGKRVIVVGERENIFHHMPQIETVASICEIEEL